VPKSTNDEALIPDAMLHVEVLKLADKYGVMDLTTYAVE